MPYFSDLHPYFGKPDPEAVVLYPNGISVVAALNPDNTITLALEIDDTRFGKFDVMLPREQFISLATVLNRLLNAPDEEVDDLRGIIRAERQKRQDQHDDL
jgi:hypothetical protein